MRCVKTQQSGKFEYLQDLLGRCTVPKRILHVQFETWYIEVRCSAIEGTIHEFLHLFS